MPALFSRKAKKASSDTPPLSASASALLWQNGQRRFQAAINTVQATYRGKSNKESF
jgi:hypothetical protein